MTAAEHRFCVAPMMDWTDRHCRFFLRQLSSRALLYTEMVTTGALIHGERERLLHFDTAEHPVALQLGGSDPADLARSAEFGEAAGYDEINLNCGCPSDRVQNGSFGACLMNDPVRVAASVKAMKGATGLPVTVKHRIGVDDTEDYPFMRQFVETVAEAGCDVFIVHARKAWLQGLSPKQNREVPPLRYELVYRLKQEFPQLRIVINGGIRSLDDCHEHLRHVDGVMLGREVYDNPYLIAAVDAELFGDAAAPPSRLDVIARMRPYLQRELASGTPLRHITRHMLGLFRGQPGGRAYRRELSQAFADDAGLEILDRAVRHVRQIPSSLAA